MLAVPRRGFAQNNVRLDALCDWLEGGVLFQTESQISASDVVDLLVEGNIYARQGLAWNRVEEAWSELRERKRLLENGYPIDIRNTHLRRKTRWQDVPAHSFCLALSFAEWYPDWANSFGRDHREQGELFEILAEESLKRSFGEWEVYRTGWSTTNSNQLSVVVQKVATWLGEPPTGTIKRWTKPAAKEAGLDLLCFRPMPDRKPGIPIYLVQCASGVPSNPLWEHKLKTPDVGLWCKLVDFAVSPRRAFATPFAFHDDDFVRYCRAVEGMFLDRFRILAPARERDTWLSQAITRRLIRWTRPRIRQLPSADEM